MSKKSTRGKRHSTDAGPPKVSSKPYEEFATRQADPRDGGLRAQVD
jgi:hypothetical protein